RVHSEKTARKSAYGHVPPPAAGERPVEAAITELGERVCIHGLEPNAQRHLLTAGHLYRLGVQVGSEPLACKRRAMWRPPTGTARDLEHATAHEHRRQPCLHRPQVPLPFRLEV